MTSPLIEETLQAPNRIIDKYNLSGVILREDVQLLCRSACDPNPEIAQAAINAIFTELVERLNDAFNPEYCILYDKLFSQVINFFRKLPEGKFLDDALNRSGIKNESDMLDRKARILGNNLNHLTKVKKIILLSRITIGADVAVTSVAISKLRNKYPDAKYVILGSAKLLELFGGDPLIRIRELKYERGGSVISRLNSWLSVIDVINDELNDIADNQYLIIDPDSRLTQLGLLPVVAYDRNYYYFESRNFTSEGLNTNAELISCWLGDIFSIKDNAFPFVALNSEHLNFSENLTRRLRASGADKIITISFGTGGNENKRVSHLFEKNVIEQLLSDNVTIILDKGASQAERDQINSIIEPLRNKGKQVVEFDELTSPPLIDKIDADIVTWDGGIGMFAALTAYSDGYIGYDSAGQHIAAALAIPVLTIFVNYNTPVFAERWRPFGQGYIRTVLFQK